MRRLRRWSSDVAIIIVGALCLLVASQVPVLLGSQTSAASHTGFLLSWSR